MIQRRWVRMCVSLGAIAAMTIFISACMGWPSWNSDGTKIAFPFLQSDSVGGDRSGVAIYDVKSDRLIEVFSSPKRKDSYPVLIPQWVEHDDLSVIAYTSDSVTIDILPLEKAGVVKHVLFNGNAPDREAIQQPSPEFDGKLYISSIGHDLDEFAIVDLKTASYEFRKFGVVDGPEPTLDSWPGGLVYTRRIILGSLPGGGSKAKWEFGSVALPEFGPKPAFELTSDDLGVSAEDMDSIVGPVAWDRRGERVALSLSKPSNMPFAVRVGNKWKLLEPTWDLKEYKILDVIWSADEKTLFVGVVSPGGDGEIDYWIGEIPIANGRSTVRKVCRVPQSDFDDASDLITFLRLSISPDGKTVATTTTTLGLSSADWNWNGLFLLDVSKADGALRFIPMTSMGAAK